MCSAVYIVFLLQVAEDGYGVSYIIPGDNVLYFHVSSFKGSPRTVSLTAIDILFEIYLFIH